LQPAYEATQASVGSPNRLPNQNMTAKEQLRQAAKAPADAANEFDQSDKSLLSGWMRSDPTSPRSRPSK